MRQPPSPDPAEPQVAPYQPIPPRRRRLIGLLAIVTALVIAWMMLRREGVLTAQQQPPADAPRCAAGQTRDCVGGTASVILAPAATAASAAAR